MKRKLPKVVTDEAAERLVADADLTQFDLRAMRPARFEFASKDARINMRLPEDLLNAVKAAAEKAGMPYQRFIRRVLEDAVNR